MVKRLRTGSALIFVLILTFMLTALVGSMGAYYVHTARMAHLYETTRSAPRQEADRALEEVKQAVEEVVANMNGQSKSGSSEGGGINAVVSAVRTKIAEINVKIDEYLGGKYHVVLVTDEPASVDGKRLLRIRAKVYDKNKAYTDENILVVLEMVIEFWGSAPTEITLPEIFSYVYFVDNYGHLETEAVIVNGNAHANNDFSIKWGVLNGKLTANGKITVANARAWPAKTYATKIKAANDSLTMTRVRPTDPITTSSQVIDWENGYKPVAVSNPYAGDYESIEAKPTVVHPDTYKPAQARPGTWTRTAPVIDSYITDVKYDAKKVKYYYYLYGVIQWSKNGLISSKKALEKEHDNKYSEAYGVYWWDLTQFNNDKAAYDKLVKEWADYDAYVTKYNNHTTDEELAWQSRANAWAQQKADWEKKYNNGEEEADLKSAKDTANKAFLEAKSEIIKMLNVSDTNEYKNICTSQGGKLTCDNTYNGSRIWWKNRGQMDGAAMMYRKATKANFSGKVTEWSAWDLDSADKNKLTKLIIEEREGTNPWRQKSTFPMRRELAQVNITGGYSNNIYPFSNYSSVNSFKTELKFLETPSVSQSLSKYGTRSYTVSYPKVSDAIKKIEKGSVILIGTESNPIIIKGPVYIDGDVVIRGVVSGRGTIYSGRNIHIIGDLVYKNPPKWPYDATGLSGTSKTKVINDNAGKDILLLSARGNVIIGDYTSSDWTDSKNSQYLRSLHGGKSGYGDTFDDSFIGYGSSFDRDYTKNDGFKKVYLSNEIPDNVKWSDLSKRTPILKAQWYYYESNGAIGLGLSSYEDQNWYYVPTLSAPSSANCKYYECVLGDAVIKGLKQLSNEEAAAEDEPASAAPPFTNGQSEKNQNSGDITQIDAILFANHGIFGVVGGTSSHKFVLNGAMACRDEGLFPSFDSRFKSNSSPEPQIWLNWDMRFTSDNDLQKMVAIATGGGCVSNKVSSWRQLSADEYQR